MRHHQATPALQTPITTDPQGGTGQADGKTVEDTAQSTGAAVDTSLWDGLDAQHTDAVVGLA